MLVYKLYSYTTNLNTFKSLEIFSAEIVWLDEKKLVSVIGSDSDFMLIGMELLKNAKTTLEPLKESLIIELSNVDN